MNDENEQRTFETTEFCLGSTKMDNFTGKNHISCREKIGNTDFGPSKKYSSYAPISDFHKATLSFWGGTEGGKSEFHLSIKQCKNWAKHNLHFLNSQVPGRNPRRMNWIILN